MSSADAMNAASKENIQKCCAMYSIYATLHGYKGPNSSEELVEFLSSDKNAQGRLERMNVDVSKMDSYLVGRDGEPLEFRWGIESSPVAPAYVVCWEKEGVDGVVQVGVTGGTILDVEDEDELAELKAGNYSTGQSYGASMNTKTLKEENE